MNAWRQGLREVLSFWKEREVIISSSSSLDFFFAFWKMKRSLGVFLFHNDLSPFKLFLVIQRLCRLWGPRDNEWPQWHLSPRRAVKRIEFGKSWWWKKHQKHQQKHSKKCVAGEVVIYAFVVVDFMWFMTLVKKSSGNFGSFSRHANIYSLLDNKVCSFSFTRFVMNTSQKLSSLDRRRKSVKNGSGVSG